MTTGNNRKIWILMGVGLLILILIIGLAFIAAKSDAENQRKYKQQHEEIARKHGLAVAE